MPSLPLANPPLVDTAGTDTLNGAVVFDVGELVDVHAITVAIGLQARISTGNRAVVDDGAVAIGAEARAIAAGDLTVVGECRAQVSGDAMAATGNAAVVGHRHAGRGVDVDTVEFVVSDSSVAGRDLAIVGDYRVGAGLHAIAGVPANQPACAVDDRRFDPGTAQRIQVQPLAGGRADNAAVVDQQAAAGEVAVDAQRVVETENLPTRAVINAVVACLGQVTAAVDRPAAGRGDPARVIDHHTHTAGAVFQAHCLASVGDAARRRNRQRICAAEGLRSGGRRVDLHILEGCGVGAGADQQRDAECQALGGEGHVRRPFCYKRAVWYSGGFLQNDVCAPPLYLHYFAF